MKIDKIERLRPRTKGRMNSVQFEIAVNSMQGLVEMVDQKIGFPCVHDGITWRPTPLTLHWVFKEVKCNRYWFGVNEKTESMLVSYVHSITNSKTKENQIIDERSHLYPYIASDYYGSLFLVRYHPYNKKKFTFQTEGSGFLVGMCVSLTSEHWRVYDSEVKDSAKGSWW